MGIADLRFGPPPGLSQTLRCREICYRTADERIYVLDHGRPPGAGGGAPPTVGASRFKQVSQASQSRGLELSQLGSLWSETYVHVGCTRSAQVATHADRQEPT